MKKIKLITNEFDFKTCIICQTELLELEPENRGYVCSHCNKQYVLKSAYTAAPHSSTESEYIIYVCDIRIDTKEKIEGLVDNLALLANSTSETIKAMATGLETACQVFIKLIEEHCMTCDFYYRNRCIMNSPNFCFNSQQHKKTVNDLLDQTKKLYESDKLEERIAADVLTFDECTLRYTRNPKTKEIEVTRLDPAKIRMVYTKENEITGTIITSPLAQSFFDEDNLFGCIRYNLRRIVEKSTDLEHVLTKDPSFSPEICFDIALNEAKWNEALSLRSDEMKSIVELEYTDPEDQVISKKFRTTIVKMDSEKRIITIEAIGTEEPAVVKGKMLRTREDIKKAFKED